MLRSLVALLSVTLMVAVGGLTLGVWNGAAGVIAELRSAVGEHSWVIRQTFQAGVQPPGLNSDRVRLAELEALPGVRLIGQVGAASKPMQGGRASYLTVPANRAFFEVRGLRLAQGRMFGAPGEAVVGAALADQLGETLNTEGGPVRVVGVLRPVGARGDIERYTDQLVIVNVDGYRGTGRITELIVQSDPAHYLALKPALEHWVAGLGRGPHEVLPLVEEVGTDIRRRAADLLSGALGFGAVVTVLAGLLNMAAFFLARALDGLRALGVRRAVGATRAQVVAEDVRAAALWALPGLLVGLPLALGLGRVLGERLSVPVELGPLAVGALAVLTLAVVTLAAYFPARWAAGHPPMLALRGVAGRVQGWQVVLTAAGLTLGTAGLVVQANIARAAQLETERVIGRVPAGVVTFAPSYVDDQDFADPRGYLQLTPFMLEDLMAQPAWSGVTRHAVRQSTDLRLRAGEKVYAERGLGLVDDLPALAALSDAALIAGRWPRPGEVALGTEAARRLLGRVEVVGQTVQVEPKFSFGAVSAPTLARVSGVFRAPRQGVIGGLDEESAVTPTGGPFAGNPFYFLIFQTPDAALPGQLAAWLDAQFGGPEVRPVRPIPPLEAAPQARAVLLQLGEVYRLLSAALLLLGGAGLMAQLLLMLARRTKEIGVRRAVGASRAQVFGDFLGETGTLGAFAAGTGLLLGVLFTLPVLSAQKVAFAVDGPALLAALGVGVGVALLFGSLPAALATRIPPAQALREGE